MADVRVVLMIIVVKLTTNFQSEMMAPKVIDITGPMRGETSIAATMLLALFSTNPKAASELNENIKTNQKKIKIKFYLLGSDNQQ